MNTRQRQPQAAVPGAGDYLIASKKCELMNLQYFLQMGQLVQCISNLVHSLQRERGASNVLLGSGGCKFHHQRQQIVAESDRLRREFEQALTAIHQQMTVHPVSSRLLNQIASALHGLADLAELRGAVDRQTISAHDATESYSSRIHRLIAVVFEAADTAVDPGIAGLLVALVHLMNGKELCGQERAVGSAGFSSGRVDSALSRRMVHLVEAQERCFEVFASFADEDSRALWQQVRSHSREAEIGRLRELGCSSGRVRQLDPQLADRWFAVMTERMDELKRVEDALEGCFHARCIERYTEARHSLSHQETLVASLDQQGGARQPVLILCESGDEATGQPGDAWASDGVGQRFGRSIFDLVQQQSRRLQAMSDELQAAKEALEDRKIQEKAVLLLMEHRRIDNDEAHRLLRKLAMNQGKKLPEVARALLAMADVLG